MSEPHQRVYMTMGFVALFVVLLVTIDYFFTLMRPEFLKSNGKVDKTRQFFYTVGISATLFLAALAIYYQFSQ